MEQPVYIKIAALAEAPDAVRKSIAYVKENMSRFLKKKDKVMICFRKQENTACQILEQAIIGCECEPIWVGEDFRWMALLKLAFTTRSDCIVGPPLLLLGLSKLAKHMGTPLYARNVLMSGYPTTNWLVNGVRQGLDCMAWGCFDPGIGPVISGFTCPQLDGVHLREDEYGVEIVDDSGHVLPDGEIGQVILYPKADPSLRFPIGDVCQLSAEPCSCGCKSPKLMNIDVIKPDGKELSELGESLHYWSSILDCRMERTECGLELELVVFQGEKLPKLPTAAKLTVRAFNPKTDIPFAHQEVLKKRYISQEAH